MVDNLALLKGLRSLITTITYSQVSSRVTLPLVPKEDLPWAGRQDFLL